MKRLLCCALVFALSASLYAEEIFVSAAASLTDAVKEIGARFEKETGTKAVLNFSASSLLARQIEEGAPADVFISADEAQMDRLQKQIVPESRRDLLTNTLVAIVRQDSALHLDKLSDLANAAITRIAIADPKAVPAGVYAREVLTKAKLWEGIANKIVPGENVRATLAVVESGNAEVGFVYKTDALSSSKVRVAFETPADLAPKIVYPMAILSSSTHRPQASKFLDYLKTEPSAETFRRLGFGLAP
jgi:molybdate transport system substrate-binding protein